MRARVCVCVCVSDGLCLLRLRLREKRQRESNLPAFCMHALSTRHRNEEWEGGDSATQCRPRTACQVCTTCVPAAPPQGPPCAASPLRARPPTPHLCWGSEPKLTPVSQRRSSDLRGLSTGSLGGEGYPSRQGAAWHPARTPLVPRVEGKDMAKAEK